MPLPMVDTFLQPGTTPYEIWRDKQKVPLVAGNYIENAMKLPLKPWDAWGDGVEGCIINMGGQEEADRHLIEIAPEVTTIPRHHMYESEFFVRSGTGKCTIWSEGSGFPKVTFDFKKGTLFGVPLNFTYQLTCTSKNEGAKIWIGTSLPITMNVYRNEDYIWNNPYQFNDRMSRNPSWFDPKQWVKFSQHGKPYLGWDANVIPDVETFELEPWPLRGPSVMYHAFTFCDNNFGSHLMEMGIAARTTVHRHGGDATIYVTRGEGFCVLFKEGEKFVPYPVHPDSVYAPSSDDYHGHFNTGNSTMRHVAYRGWLGGASNYSWRIMMPAKSQMLAFNEEPPELQEYYLSELKKHGVTQKFVLTQA